MHKRFKRNERMNERTKVPMYARGGPVLEELASTLLHNFGLLL
jgi:hypothetical protein